MDGAGVGLDEEFGRIDALAEHEANTRKLQGMWKLVANRTEYAGKVGDELAALVRDEIT